MLIAVGAAIRLWGLARQPLNADEAVVGLMAHEILRGHLSAFFWGQRYGGAEAYAVAGVFALLGQSPLSLGLTPVLLDAVAAVLVWRIGRRLFFPAAGVLAALLFWIWPEVFVQFSILEYGFRWLALVCGLVMLLEALRIVEATPRAVPTPLVSRANWALLGLALGIGWWSTPEIAYYALPALGLVAVRTVRRRVAWSPVNLAIGLFSAVLGAAPWLWDNVGHGFASVHERRHSVAEFMRHLRDLGTHVLPMAFGLRLRLSGAWIISPATGEALYAILLVVTAVVVVRLLVERRALVLVAFCALAPLEYAAAPTNYWGDGRYSLYFAPVIALLVAVAALDGAAWVVGRFGVDRAPGVRALVLGSALALALALTLATLPRLSPFRAAPLVASEHSWTESHSNPNGWLAPVLSSLLGAHVRDLYAGYWVGTVLDFDSHAALTSTDLPFSRYPPYTRAVESSPRAAWLFMNPRDAARVKAETSTTLVDPGCNDNHRGCLALPVFVRYLHSTGDGFETRRVGDFIWVLPERPVQVAAFLADVHRWH